MRQRKVSFKRTKRLFVIATEGAETEPIYFDLFRCGRDHDIRIKILDNYNHKSRPIDVYKRLIAYEREHKLGENTEYWAVIDRDSWHKSEIDEVAAKMALRTNYNLAVSNPCFELWIWLHLGNNRSFFDRTSCQRQLARLWPEYRKGKYDVQKLLPGIRQACDRARALDAESEHVWPQNQGTTLYKLIEKLM